MSIQSEGKNIMNVSYTELHFRKRKTLSADSKVCAGCRTCEIICSLSHEGVIDIEKSRILVKSNFFKGSFTPRICHQCSDFPCLYACPEAAIRVDPDLGIILIDEEKCTGCRECEKACPFKIIRYDEQNEKAFKCDFCDGDPKCVRWCPVNALGITEFGGEI
jgi:Fe-S-cluster-containing hydrogenase component 2